MIPYAEDTSPTGARPTPLHRAAVSACEVMQWTSVQGWALAEVYREVYAEYDTLQAGAGLADMGGFARYRIVGQDAALYVSRLTSAAAARMEPGAGAQALLCTEHGRVVDLVNVGRVEPGVFLLTLTRPRPWRLQAAARGFDVLIEDVSDDYAALGVFGPKTDEVLSAAGFGAETRAHDAAVTRIKGVDTIVLRSRVGSAEGVELLAPREEGLIVWERLLRAGGEGGLAPVGLKALDAARLEAAAPRMGADFFGAEDVSNIAMSRTPFELGLGERAPLDSAWFSGRSGARRLGAAPRRRALLSLAIATESLSAGASVYHEGRVVGSVTSWAMDPCARRVLALADVDATVAARTEFEVERAGFDPVAPGQVRRASARVRAPQTSDEPLSAQR